MYRINWTYGNSKLNEDFSILKNAMEYYLYLSKNPSNKDITLMKLINNEYVII